MAIAVHVDTSLPIRPLSVSDFWRMWDAGVFAEDEKVELLRGVVVEKPHATPEHDYAIEWLNMRLVPLAIAAGVSVRVQSTMVFEEQDSVPLPDLVILDLRRRGDAQPTTARIAIEVSVSSLRVDMKLKADLYAEVGIPEYWVIDVHGRTVIRHHAPTPTGYAATEHLGPGDELRSVAVPGFPPLRVADVLDADVR
jgi:Uma2 family endonuclease